VMALCIRNIPQAVARQLWAAVFPLPAPNIHTWRVFFYLDQCWKSTYIQESKPKPPHSQDSRNTETCPSREGIQSCEALYLHHWLAPRVKATTSHTFAFLCNFPWRDISTNIDAVQE
jgi:hypothetical protein